MENVGLKHPNFINFVFDWVFRSKQTYFGVFCVNEVYKFFILDGLIFGSWS